MGDDVTAHVEAGAWSVEEIHPRRSEFVRQGLRTERQVLFANADRVLIIASLASPRTKSAAIDRFLVAALRGGIEPILVLTKTDLDLDEIHQRALLDLYESFRLRVYPVSNERGEGHDNLRQEIASGTTALIGNSGVGKTSLMNQLIPGLDLATREVSAWSGKGTHTTTSALLVPFTSPLSVKPEDAPSSLIDTPGMKSFVPFGIDRANLLELFPDLSERASDCRFTNCGHNTEPDCAVHIAISTGQIAASRLKSYHRLLSELS